MSDSQQLAQRLNKLITKQAEGEYATLGRFEDSGVRTVPVEGMTNWVYACLNDDPLRLIVALNHRVTPLPRLPVRVKKNRHGIYIVLGTDEVMADAFAHDAAPTLNIPALIGSAAKVIWESFQFAPGRIEPLNGTDLQIHMRPLSYGDVLLGNVNGDLTTIVGTIGSSKKAWIVVAVDPDTNTLTYTKGSDIGLVLTLTEQDANEISIAAGHIKLWAFICRNGDTTLPVQAIAPDTLYYADLRPWITIAAGGTDITAIHTDAESEIDGLTEKTSLVNDDLFLIEDSADSFAKKKVKKSNVVSSSSAPDYILLQDQETQGTDGGTFTSGAWQPRTLNTIVTDTGSHVVSLASNQFVLDAGTYEMIAYAPAHNVDRHQARFYNITDSAVILLGTSEYTGNASFAVTKSVIVGRFTIAASKTLEIQHQCQTTRSTDGFGVDANFTTEIYTTLELRKVA